MGKWFSRTLPVLAAGLLVIALMSSHMPTYGAGSPLDAEAPFLRAKHLRGHLDQSQAQRLAKGLRRVHYRYSFQDIGPRRNGWAPRWMEPYQGGQCESAVAAIAAYGTKHGLPDIVATNLVVDRGDGHLSGHVIGTMTTASGAIAFDTTFGLVFITSQPRFSTDVLSDRDFAMYRIGRSPEGYYNSPVMGLTYYRGFQRDRAAVQDADGRQLVVSPRYTTRHGFLVGMVDGDHEDVVAELSEWEAHIGGYYLPTRHVWRILTVPGQAYRMSFHLAPAESVEFRLNITLGDENDSAMVMNYDRRLVVEFIASDVETDIALGSEEVRSRWLDAVELAPSDADRLAVETFS